MPFEREALAARGPRGHEPKLRAASSSLLGCSPVREWRHRRASGGRLPGANGALQAVTREFYGLSGFDESAVARYIRAHRAELPHDGG